MLVHTPSTLRGRPEDNLRCYFFKDKISCWLGLELPNLATLISQRAPVYLTLLPQHQGYEHKLQGSAVLVMGSGDWTLVFVLAKQALYRLSHFSRLFLSFQICILVVKLGCWFLCPRFLLTCNLSHTSCLSTLSLHFYSDTGLWLFIALLYILTLVDY